MIPLTVKHIRHYITEDEIADEMPIFNISLENITCMKIDNTGWIRVLRFIFSYLLIATLFQLLGTLLLGIDPIDINTEKSSFQELVIVFFDLTGAFAALWLFTVKADNERFRKLGFQTKHFFKEFGSGFGIGAFAIVLGYLLLLGLKDIHYDGIQFDPLEIIISTALFMFVAVSEEAVFRGYVLRNLLISFNKYIALAISAILFASLHLINPHITMMGAINLFLAGILCGIAYIYTKNLWLPIAIHFSWNLFQTLMGFNVSGHDIYSLIEFHATDNNWINGGSFGFEGSIISIGIQVLIILGISLFYKQEKTT